MIGKTVGKYRIVSRLGRGGMGTVYKAVDETLDREVAIKVLNPDLGDTEVLRRFRAEAVTLARLNHPGIATLFELHRHDDELLMVMEFVRGETFHDLLVRLGPLAPPQAAHLCTQVLDALGHAHRAGVVHRDLKPANLMISEHGTVKVMDFGIARVLGSEHFTHGGYMMGTPAYMAPEQVLGRELDGRADLYSIGVVFYRLLSDKLPFDADTAIGMVQKQISDEPTPIATYRPDLPEWCTNVIGRAMAKTPAGRFQTAEEFRAALARAVTPQTLGELPTMATPTPYGLPLLDEATLTGEPAGTSAPASSPQTGAGDLSALTRTSLSAESLLPDRAGTPSSGPATGRTATTTVVMGRTHLFALTAVVVVLTIAVAVLALMALRRGTSLPEQLQQLGQAVIPADADPSPSEAGTPAATESESTAGAGEQASEGSSTSPEQPAPAARQEAAGGARPAAAQVERTPADRAALTGEAKAAEKSTNGARDQSAADDASGSNAATSPASEEAAPIVTFKDVRILVDESGRAREREGVLQLAGGTMSVLNRDGTATLASLPYDAVVAAFYSRSKQPKWRDADGQVVEGRVDHGPFGAFKGDRNWLILAMKDGRLIIRIDDSGLRTILPAVQARTGVPIQR